MEEKNQLSRRETPASPKKLVKKRPTTRQASVSDNKHALVEHKATVPTLPRIDKEVPVCPHKTSFILVLDLDETLVHTGFHTVGTPSDHKYVLDVDGYKMRGTIRPYARQFLKFVHHFSERVIIWSAGTASYVKSVVEVLYDGMSEKPSMVLSRNDCHKVPHGSEFFYSKPIRTLAERIIYNPDQVVMLDDKLHTFIFNPDHGVQVPEYKGESQDEGLLNLMEWMSKPHVRRSDTITQLDKSNIFSSRMVENIA